MTEHQFKNEIIYQTTLHLLRELLDEGVITKDRYKQLNKFFADKYKPVFRLSDED